ncbi:MAG TPA: AI-2E family transporter [Candidatus Paceibacterota bacterium]|nr:AI-2E family transporter [Candidatus Paceibacterota bacterium]
MKETPNITINITSGTIIKTILFLVLAWVLFLLRGLVLILLVAVTIASAIEPGTSWLVKRKFPRALATLTVYALIILVFISIFYFVIPPLLSETASLLTNLPQYVKTIDLINPFHNDAFANFTSALPGLPQSISIDSIINTITSSFAGLSSGFFSTISGIFGGVVSFILIVVLSFYLAVREDGVADFLGIVTPPSHEKYVINLWRRARTKIGRWMQGQLLLGLIVAILIFLGLNIFGIQHPLTLAILAGVFELIPVVGMTMAGIPAFLLGYLQGGWTLAFLIVGLYIIVQQFEAHLIYPLVVRKIVGIPPLLVIIALIAGGELAGFFGIILSIPISVTLMEFLDDLEHKRHPKLKEESLK